MVHSCQRSASADRRDFAVNHAEATLFNTATVSTPPPGGSWVLKHLVGIVLTRPLLRNSDRRVRATGARCGAWSATAPTYRAPWRQWLPLLLAGRAFAQATLSGEGVASALGPLTGNMRSPARSCTDRGFGGRRSDRTRRAVCTASLASAAPRLVTCSVPRTC
jgi:hypothetical protein